MELEVRPCATTEEFVAAVQGIGQYFGLPADAETAERFLRNLPLERMHAALDDGRVVGGAGALPLELSVPGGRVRCAGVTLVGVYPTHRRRGVLRALMRAQLDDVHRRGESIATLWASEEPIYGRFGYGLASWTGEIEAPHEYAEFARPLERRGTARLVDTGEARELFPPIWDALMAERPGVFARTPAWWESRILADPPERREGAGPKRFLVLERAGEPCGYAVYRHSPKFEAGVSVATLRVLEAIGADPQATAELWRYLLDVDWTATVRAWLLPPDHPLFLLAAFPRRLRYRRGDGLWVRIVDVAAALAGRTYATDDPLVFELADAFCPWNEGRWRLADGRVERTRTDEPADLRLDVAALGAAYLGGTSFRDLAAALQVEELRPGALAAADGAFHSPAHPWCPEIF